MYAEIYKAEWLIAGIKKLHFSILKDSVLP